MAACLAAPWPSQQRSNRSTSERHSALARMRERHARADRGLTPDPEPAPRSRPQQPRPPAQPRSNDARPSQRLGALSGSGGVDLSAKGREPWAQAWSPEPHESMDLDSCETPPPKPQRPVPPDEALRKPWATAPEEKLQKARPTPRSEKTACGPCDDGMNRGNRVRAAAEVKTARDVEADDEDLPPGVQKADFKTLQAMIARGIQDAETGAVKLESDIPTLHGEDDEERRFRERQRQRREQEAAQREREREVARQRRRREQEERERRQAEELEREEREELSLRENRAQAEEQCRRELAAAVQIQAHVRGRRSRAGKPHATGCVLKPVLHWEPWMK